MIVGWMGSQIVQKQFLFRLCKASALLCFENMRLLQLLQNTVRRIVGDISVIDCHLQNLMKHRVDRINCGRLYIPFIDQMIVEPLHI